MTLDLEFFAAAAQLIPLLVVAAAVDTRMWANSDKALPSDITFELFSLVAITTAWVVSLYVIATGENGSLAGMTVSLGLAIGWVQVVGSIGVHQLRRLGHARVTRRQLVWLAFLVLIPLGTVAALAMSTL